MTKDKSLIQSCIDHINTAIDVDPWAVEIAVEALGKQIPKKAVYVEEDRYVKNRYYTFPQCPSCDHEIATGDAYCLMCGQAIDWEEVWE